MVNSGLKPADSLLQMHIKIDRVGFHLPLIKKFYENDLEQSDLW